ncbi:MAG: sulfotransferase [Thiohalocapsa sp.]
MFDLFLISSKRFASLSLSALTRSPDGETSIGIRRVLVMLGFLPIFALIQGIHWVGFLLDDILFRGWRSIRIQEPVFVLGVPRSGTTKLHQVLAKDDQFTTFSAWECLFALSVTERRFWLGLTRIDALFGGPGAGLLDWLQHRVFASLDDVHAMSLTTPEEDYFALMPILSCFILALPFPGAEHLWRIGRFDQVLSDGERSRVLEFYQDCLKKHLYVHGEHKRLLSKNAAFAPLANSLAEHFTDSRFLICLRDPMETIPSQLSSIRSGLAFFGVPPDSIPIRDRFVNQLAFYYQNLDTLARTLRPNRCVTVTLLDLKADLATTLCAVYQRLELPLSGAFGQLLEAESSAARHYRSGHNYSLEQFALEPSEIDARFSRPYRQASQGPNALMLETSNPEVDPHPTLRLQSAIQEPLAQAMRSKDSDKTTRGATPIPLRAGTDTGGAGTC